MSVLLYVFALLISFGATYRLPNNTVPIHYELYLDTDIHLGVLDYSGSVTIDIRVVEPTNQIVLHSTRSVLTDVRLYRENGVPIAIQNHEFDSLWQFLIVNTRTTLTAGSTVQLQIQFFNSIDRSDNHGFYRTTYTDDLGDLKYAGVTQFQACDARSSFPCYDEPGIKATFLVKIECGTSYHVNANAPLSSILIRPNGKKLLTFHVTPRMQTYLLAFLVSDYAYIRTITHSPKTITLESLARPTRATELEYSLDAAEKLINRLQEYFDYPYELSKMDNVAIPNVDFALGAMENWGMITYRESYMLIGDNPTEAQLRTVSTIIAHELTHQFFGNLMAPEWWSYLWLNEGFATVYEYYLADQIYPEFALKDRFPGSVLQPALNFDGYTTVRPMTSYVETVPEIDALFDTISYEKAGSVLRMMSYAIGEDTFIKGLRHYIRNNAHSVVTSADLYRSLQWAIDEDNVEWPDATISQIADCWARQAGAPVVTVHRGALSNIFTFTQERFFYTAPEEANEQTWWIPIFLYSNQSGEIYTSKPFMWLAPKDVSIVQIIGILPDDIMVINPGQPGYYRVNYDEQTWREIAHRLMLSDDYFDGPTRGQLLDDSMHLAHAGKLSYDIAFSVFDSLRHDDSIIPWITAVRNIETLERMVAQDSNARLDLRTYVDSLISDSLLDDEVQQQNERQMLLLDLACRLSLTYCSRYAADKMVLVKSVQQFATVTPAEEILQCALMKSSGRAAFQQYERLYTLSNDSSTKLTIMRSLLCSNEFELLKQFIASVSINERIVAIKHLANSGGYDGLILAVELLSSNVHELIAMKTPLSAVVNDIAPLIITKYAAEILEVAIASLDKGSNNMKATWRKTIDERISWNERSLKPMHEALKKFTAGTYEQ